MIANLPLYISIFFGITTLATLLLFYYTVKKSTDIAISNKSNFILLGFTIWLTLQAVLTFSKVYSANTNTIPPKIFIFGILPTIIVIVLLFTTQKGKKFVTGLPLINLTYLNIVRLPVEMVLLWLFLNKAVPQIMTFEGKNFDILAGISSPFIAYFGLVKGKLNPKIILIWNFICLLLLLNIVLIALFSAPSPFQKLAFNQPNIGILNFPFSWLPTFIVPVVLFGHLVSIKQLLKQNK